MIEARDRCEGRSSTGPWTCGEWGSCDLAVDDSPGSYVRALYDGCGWAGDGREDPALVLSLRCTGAEGMGVGDTTLVVVGGELCPVAGSGEKRRTRGLKLYMPG